MSKEVMQQALEALELAQDNLRDHGDNCFLHDEGEYNRCFCGKDSLSDHLQSVVEKLDEALAEQPAPVQQEPVAVWELQEDGWDTICDGDWLQTLPVGTKLYTTPPQRTWVGLTDDRSHQILLDMAKHIETFGDESTTEQALSAECIRFILERVTAHGIKKKA